MNSKLRIIRKIHPYFHAVVLLLAVTGIINCFVSLPNIYEAAVVFVESIDILNIDWGANKANPTDFVQ